MGPERRASLDRDGDAKEGCRPDVHSGALTAPSREEARGAMMVIHVDAGALYALESDGCAADKQQMLAHSSQSRDGGVKEPAT